MSNYDTWKLRSDRDDGPEPEGGKYWCTVCGVHQVDAENGYDTCEVCMQSMYGQ